VVDDDGLGAFEPIDAEQPRRPRAVELAGQQLMQYIASLAPDLFMTLVAELNELRIRTEITLCDTVRDVFGLRPS
jgi:hypothetical protein